MKDNADRIASAEKRGTLPYFLRDNITLDEATGAYIFKHAKPQKPSLQDAYPEEWRKKNLAIAEARHKARTEEEIDDIQDFWDCRTIQNELNAINGSLSKGEKWLQNGNVFTVVPTGKAYNAATDLKGEIQISKKKQYDTTNSILRDAASAIRKIKTGRTNEINRFEARSIGTVWHEITHNRNVFGNMGLSDIERDAMEMMNEFVARHTLPEFYERMGVKRKDIPFPEFMTHRENTGYEPMVQAYQYIINTLGLDMGLAVQRAGFGLFYTKYALQKQTAIDALIEACIYNIKTPKGKTLTNRTIESLVVASRDNLFPNFFPKIDKILKKYGLIIE